MLGLRGFAPLYEFVGSWLGIDPGMMLTVLGILWAAQKIGQQLFSLCRLIVTSYLMSSVHIASTDDIYLHMMKWLATQPRMTSSRSLMVETTSKTAWEDDEDTSKMARDRSGKYLNFSNQEARAPPQFVPAMGKHSFWWQGQLFTLHRKQESIFDDGASNGASTFRDKEDLVISCLWRSPEPIKKLLQHAKDQYYKDHQARTVVKRPFPHNMRRFARNSWQIVANRPVRDMRTVVLGARQKAQILADLNEYLHPSTPRWYANRGIPLRRGYLFHGPPGTGKTSLSFALAGVFGLDIHVISLLEPTLTEEDLSALLGSLPRRCIVLLEDIDTAGLRRPENELEKSDRESRRLGGGGSGRGGRRGPNHKNKKAEGEGKENTAEGAEAKDDTVSAQPSSSSPNDWKVSDLARALKTEAGAATDDKKQGISLSGLLNAIDGVASHEGRVLIMTTNAPETLDEALIRPGRVDLQVAFSNATTKQAEELFLRMYESDERVEIMLQQGVDGTNRAVVTDSEQGFASNPVAANGHDKRTRGSEDVEDIKALIETTRDKDHNPEEDETDEDDDVGEKPEPILSDFQLRFVAKEFASRIPDDHFSPAEIQGFLLKRKKHPLRAVREAEQWVDALVRQKESHSKVLRVQ